jgi:transposase
MAISQIQHQGPGRDHYLRKRAAAKSHKEAMRCLKRRLTDVVYRQLLNDAQGTPGRAREDNKGPATESSAAGSNP